MFQSLRQFAKTIAGILALFWMFNGIAVASYNCGSFDEDISPVSKPASMPCHQEPPPQHNCDDVCVCAQVDTVSGEQLDTKSFTAFVVAFLVTSIDWPKNTYAFPEPQTQATAHSPPYLLNCRFLI